MSAPLFVVRGTPTAVELAAVLAVLSARGEPAAAPEAPRRSRWSAPRLRTPVVPGPGAWHAAGLPG